MLWKLKKQCVWGGDEEMRVHEGEEHRTVLESEAPFREFSIDFSVFICIDSLW